MRIQITRGVVLGGLASAIFLLYGVRAAALFDLGNSALLADLLANAAKQLATAKESLSELRRSYSEVKKVADYANDAASAAGSFQRFSARRFGDRFLSDLDAARPDPARLRRDSIAGVGLQGSDWARGTDTLQRLSSYCLADAPGARPACVKLRSELESAKVLGALSTTFGGGAGARAQQARVVDAEVAAAIQADAAQDRAGELQKARLRELLRRCNSAPALGDLREAKQIAEECQLASQQAQLLHLEEGQETNAKLAQIARLQALAIEQRNAELRRELAEAEARRQALTAGVDDLARQRVSIRGGGVEW
jgi:hypothetical protein